MNAFDQALSEHSLRLKRGKLEILQLNVGKLCNITCSHCHVNAGPKRKEIITRETIDRILEWLEPTSVRTVDLTGGAPEMIPDFKYLVSSLRSFGRHVIDRCNLVILLEPGYEDMAQFLADQKVEIVASLPCYLEENVDEQRGSGVFRNSIAALRRLNELGYGSNPDLPLHLVYNPVGPQLPPAQIELEADYKEELKKRYNITFSGLFTITNMPIARYKSYLKNSGQLDDYMQLLRESFNPHTVDDLMCRNTLSVGWQGDVYDCDFNQQLGLRLRNGKPWSLWDISPDSLNHREILTAEHCFGCTAGCGSSCGGSLS